jgi:hypothetical protein
MSTGQMSTAMGECERLARDEGLAAGLAMALAGIEAVATAPGRFAAVPCPDAPAGTPVRTDSMADREGIVFVECPGERPAGTHSLVEVGRMLAAVRLGIVRRMLDQAVQHLTDRVVGDEPLIRKQLVTGTVADVMAEIELLRGYADAQHDPEALGDLHARLDEMGWQVAKLFGAAGYIADHPARVLYVSALVANTWVDREGALR